MDTTAASGRGVGRRALLAAGAAGGLGAALTASSPSVSARSTAAALDPADWESVRAQFTLDPELSHFAAYVLASHPAPVREAIARHRDGLDVDTEGYLSAGRFEDQARAAAARYLGAKPREVALTDSTTMGMGLLLGGIAIRADQEALSTTHDFIGTGAALRLLADRTGASVRKVRLYERPSLADADEMVERLRAAIRPSTRLLVVTWVHSGTGVRVPVRRIGALVARVNENRSGRDRLLLVVDGVHGLGVVDQQVADLGCDFFTAGTHKWLFGPRGTGVLWGRAWSQVVPTIPTFSGGIKPGEFHTPGGFHSFEHRWALTEAVEFMESIGTARVERRTVSQAARLKDGLAEVPGVRVHTPRGPDVSAGIVCFSVDGLDAFTAVSRLRDEHGVVGSVTPYLRQYVRLGPSIVTTPEQVDAAVEAVASL